ncbi:ParB/RepB/Spo0J family partition protein [Intestinibacillus massiliensis]|uniref:ParB/RepB/Spo0J family partition protein n=1 Tax=Intestinibacillus massiliensis TaxID=1871029 RepID=UPI000B35A426|nr:ParB/RepB/Spo0J family partition protein [Intestinibacillus massiliensis]MCB6366025.1 ParB/RepB/Spo0J family partition protein [Intestinibacillus massiliensis]
MLSTLIGGGIDRSLRKIKLSAITRNPYQPRKYFDPEAITQLAESIRQYGVLNPLTVRRIGTGFELIAGERRMRAAKAAGLTEVPCIVMSADEQDSSAIALVENLQRRDLDFFEEAWGYKRLIELHGLTQEEAARKVGKTQSAVANKLRLLKLSPRNMQLIRDGNLTERHARCILRLPDEAARLSATEYIIAHELNVSRSEQYIDRLLAEPNEKEKERHVLRFIKDVRFFLNTVDKAVDVMQQSGVEAKVEKEEQEAGLLVHILIPNAKK